ncbi:N-acetylmuramoyl-L-alanine amidase [Streptococcus constellatus]|uniref:N-acetylmuramoyl-L-alanine amidase n=1 Tax=Streptococcus constellatus TaxID=76860 RepID=UPI001239CACA|nr:N-acetylmuramoyl-L-alanine amidase [Streptococcus constellatus]QQC23146.1 N-acetylmuramoyl-L-alanine amidase [Streptococcus constellatus]
MSNSSLVNMTMLSPNHSGHRNQPITKIAIHHTAGAISAATIGQIFRPTSRQASCNYGIGNDNKIVLCVDEANRSWCTSSSWCDNRAVTIEVANSANGGNWPVSDRTLATLIDLVTDICRRNGIRNCTYTGGKDGVLQKHEWYANTNCPGPYLGSKFSYIASEVNKRLSGNSSSSGGTSTSSLYRVRKSWSDVKSQKGAFRDFDNAKKCANANAGYKVFDASGNEVYPNKVTISKSVDTLAHEVLAGNWGNGSDRANRLRAAGYDYDTVQNRVNEILSGTNSNPNRKPIDILAREVIIGDWGNGQDRVNRLTSAGYDYNAVQKRVNETL